MKVGALYYTISHFETYIMFFKKEIIKKILLYFKAKKWQHGAHLKMFCWD